MRNRLLAIIATLALIGLFPASAYAAWPVNADCDHFAGGNYWGNVWNQQNNGTWITSVYSSIYLDTSRFQPCSNPWLNEISGTSQWIAIDAPSVPSPRDIIQFGVIKCGISYTSSDPNSPCYPGRNNTLRYFYAYGHDDNCELDPGNRSPVPVDLGPAGSGWHTFQITRSRTLDSYSFFLDGVRFQLSIPEYKVCWASNPSITRADWSVERWDPGDGFGGAGPVYFDNTKFAHDLGSLQTATFNLNNCSLDPEFNCAVPQSDEVTFWTVQQ